MTLFTIIAVIIGALWYTIGFVFVFNLAFIAIALYALANGGLRYLYIVFCTIPRDLRACIHYIRFQVYAYYLRHYDYAVKDLFAQVFEKDPDKVLLIMDEHRWTALQIEQYSNRVANVFKKMGIGKGDVVGLMMENKPEYVCIWLGLSKIGAIGALINYNLRQSSLAHCVNISNCNIFIYEDCFIDAVKDIKDLVTSKQMFCWHYGDKLDLPESGTFPWIKSIIPLIKEAPFSSPTVNDKIGYHDIILYIYTSGTTGLPKAAVISNARAIFLTGAIRYQMEWSASDVFYTPLPLYHTAGGITCTGQAIMYGNTVVMRKKFSASSYFPDIVKYNCTVAQYIGEMCRYVLSTKPNPDDTRHRLRMVFGNGLRPQIWREFVQRFNIRKVGEFYGATEGNANIINVDNKEGAIGFISRIIPAVYPISIIKVNDDTGEPVRNEKGLCIECKPDEPGVFIGKISENPARAFLGYVNESESGKKIVRDVFRKGDSAFLSGDIVVFDEFGYLFFKDRTGDTFRWKGENVSTNEVESIISSISNHNDCVVYGVEIPGTEGRAGMVAIVDCRRDLDVSSIAENIKGHLPSYAIPIFVRVLDEVELTGTYKLKKLDLQKEGFNPNVIQDKLYYLNKQTYVPLTKEIYEDIKNCKLRF